MTSDAALHAAIERIADRLNEFVAWVNNQSSQGVNVFARACEPRPPKANAPDPTLVGLKPAELAKVLAERGDSAPRNDPTGEGMLHAESEGRRRTMSKYAEAAMANMGALIDFVEHGQPKALSQRAANQLANDNEKGCYSCARLFVAEGVKRNEPVHRMGLCRWCDAFEKGHGEVPTLEQVTQHHAGRRVTVRAS